MSQVMVIGVVNGVMYGLLALGVVMIYRGTRVLSFAQPELGTVTAFITWALVTQHGWPWLAGAGVGIAVAVVASLLFERLVVRPMADAPRLSVTVATIGMMLLTLGVSAKVWGGSPRSLPPPISGLGRQVAGVFVSPTQLLSLVVAVLLGVGLTRFLRRSDFGLGVLAASEDTTAARLNGIPVDRVSAFTWGVAGALAGIAALFIFPTLGAFTFGMMIKFFIFGLAAALVGGLTSLTGAFVGGLVVGVLTESAKYAFLGSPVPGADTILVFVLIVGVLLLRPQGLLGRAGRTV